MNEEHNEDRALAEETQAPTIDYIHPDDVIEYCYRHPQTEAYLHCYECNKPICAACAQRTPVGYICPDCKKGRKQRFNKSKPRDLIVAGIIALVLSLIASLVAWVGNIWYIMILSPIAGALIAEAVWRLVGRRWGPNLWWITVGGIVLGTLPAILFYGVNFVSYTVFGGEISWWVIQDVIVPILHAGIASGAAIARLRLT